MNFIVDGYGVFPFFVIFVKIKPDEELVRIRKEILHDIISYCKIKEVDRQYKPHATLALRMGLIKFFRIWLYMRSKPRLIFTNHIIRITLLKENRILYEYDFLQRRLFSREQALNKVLLSQSFQKLKEYKKKNN